MEMLHWTILHPTDVCAAILYYFSTNVAASSPERALWSGVEVIADSVSFDKRFPRQVKRAAAGTDLRVAGKEGLGVKCADPIEARLT